MSDSPHYFTFEPSIVRDAAGLPTGFSGVAYSGGVIPNYSHNDVWYGDVAIDIDTMSVPDRLFALVHHEPDDRAGHCQPTIDSSQLRVAGVFSKVTESGQSVAGEFNEGAPWKLSVGINGSVETMDPPQTITLNGKIMTVGAIFRNTRLLEVSFVYADADPNTTVAAFSAKNSTVPPTEHSMAEENARIAALEAQVSDLTAKFAAEKTRADTAEAALHETKSAARMAAVKSLFEATGLEFSDEKAKPYLGMEEAAFSAVAETMKAIRPAADPSLFEATATNGKPKEPVEAQMSAHDIYAMRAQQATAARTRSN